MLRMFMSMYDMEVVDEEVFLKWKEEVNDEYPGKGKALFQVRTQSLWPSLLLKSVLCIVAVYSKVTGP